PGVQGRQPGGVQRRPAAGWRPGDTPGGHGSRQQAESLPRLDLPRRGHSPRLAAAKLMAFTLVAPCEYREEIRKSRFLALAAPVESAQQALAFIDQHRDSSASHNCWAFKCGAQYRFSDDGEPGGTAGRPILAAIEGQVHDQVVVLVIRWYGGIPLGTGGLARAYGGSAAKCLQGGERVELVTRIG